jgi:hypothetical protein
LRRDLRRPLQIIVGSNDIVKSKKFYDALFVAMGAQPGVEDVRGRLSYTHNGGRFMVSKPIDGQPAMPMGARRSKTRPGCARGHPARSASLTFTIPTATNCVRFIACRRAELSQIQN